MIDKLNLNPLLLAYLGDTYFELYIRNYLIDKNILKINELQKNKVSYVNAISQAKQLEKLIDNNKLTADEMDIVMRARNHKVNHKPKNTDIITYKHATAFEALLGYLYVKENLKRLNEIIEYVIGD